MLGTRGSLCYCSRVTQQARLHRWSLSPWDWNPPELDGRLGSACPWRQGQGAGHGPAFSVCVLLGFQCARTASKWTLPPSRGSWLQMSSPPSSWRSPCIVSLATTRDACLEVRGRSHWLPAGGTGSAWASLGAVWYLRTSHRSPQSHCRLQAACLG